MLGVKRKTKASILSRRVIYNFNRIIPAAVLRIACRGSKEIVGNTTWGATVTVGRGQRGSHGSGEEGSETGCILKIEPKRFEDGSHRGVCMR